MKKTLLWLAVAVMVGGQLFLATQAMYSGDACTKCKCEVFVSKSLSSTCICGHKVADHKNGKSNAPEL